MKGAERWEAETQLCLTPLKSVVDQDIQVAKGEGEGGRSFRPEIREMPGLKQKKKHFWPLRALGPDYMVSFITG